MFYIKTSGPDHLTEKHTFSRSRQIFLNEMELEKHSTCQLTGAPNEDIVQNHLT